MRIEKLVPGGDGLGHLDGGVVFVPLTAPGDLVTLTRVRRRRGVRFAEPGDIVERSPARRDPPCPWFGSCGGCQWMQMHYGYQVLWKEDILRQALRRIARIEERQPIRAHPAPTEYHYRYRARLQIKGDVAGFYRRASRRIVPWERCMLLPEAVNTAVEGLRVWLRTNNRSRKLSGCEIALSPVDGSMTVNWVFSRARDTSQAARAVMDGAEEAISGRGCDLAGQAVRTPGGAIIASRGGSLPLEVEGVRMAASPGTFFQVNPSVNEVLVGKVLAHLKSAGSEALLDLYCGNGNFSLPAAAAGIKTVGVESSPEAVRDAMSVSGPDSCFIEMDAARYLLPERGLFDAVIVDPPRTGLPPEVTAMLSSERVPLLLYVSCDVSTLARDLARLTLAGYAVSDMELLDMFPQTSHAEALVVMRG